jgi:hypothetical protein
VFGDEEIAISEVRMRNLPVVGIMALSLAIAASVGISRHAIPGSRTDPQSPREVFLERVDRYVALHRRLEADLPPERVTADPEALLLPRIALARELRKARADARQGAIFTPAVSDYFRKLIAEALRAGRIENFLEIVEEENFVRVIPAVNGDYPAGASISLMPPCLLAALPPLPDELQYRFLSRDLILWDLHPGLIVDFIPRALVETTLPPCP